MFHFERLFLAGILLMIYSFCRAHFQLSTLVNTCFSFFDVHFHQRVVPVCVCVFVFSLVQIAITLFKCIFVLPFFSVYHYTVTLYELASRLIE